jgi:drug/metabolite transporter (DMT)-like permease
LFPGSGEIFALVSAITWALAVILFKKSGETVHPIALNSIKNAVAIVLILPTMWIVGETLFRHVPARDYLIVFISGALGIGIADTLYFMCLNRIGASLTAIVSCLYSPIIIVLSIFWLDESLTYLQIFGVVLIIAAVLIVTGRNGNNSVSRKKMIGGIILGVLAVSSTAIGIVMVKPLLNSSPLLWITELRLIAGIVILIPILLIHPRRKEITISAYNVTGWKYTLSGAFVGTYLTLILWLAGMKYAQVSVASALNQTGNIFIFIFAAILLKEDVNLRKVIAIIVGVAGAMIVVTG